MAEKMRQYKRKMQKAKKPKRHTVVGKSGKNPPQTEIEESTCRFIPIVFFNKYSS